MHALTWPAKHHEAAKDYAVDWSRRFPDTDLVNAQFSVVSGAIELGTQSLQSKVAQVKLSGGLPCPPAYLRQPAPVAVILCTVETASGLVDAVEISICTL